jgi:hypothetical protein
MSIGIFLLGYFCWDIFYAGFSEGYQQEPDNLILE